MPTAQKGIIPMRLAGHKAVLRHDPDDGDTWTDPTQATDWFTARAREHAASFASDYDRAPEALSAKFHRTAEAVAAGEDVVGGWYLTGQRFLSVCLIACSPHRLRPEIRCPLR